MRAVFAYIEDHLILPHEYCRFMPCLSESAICGCYEGITASGDAVMCALDSTGEAV